MESTLSIGELAEKAEVNIQTIRFYERQGVLRPVSRKSSGYRVYNTESLKRLVFIRRAKELGFSLKEIHDLLDLRIRSVHKRDKVRAKAEFKLEEIRRKITQLKDLEKTLTGLISDCEKKVVSDCCCPILERMEVSHG